MSLAMQRGTPLYVVFAELFLPFVSAAILFLPFFGSGLVLLSNTDLLFTHYPNIFFGHDAIRNGELGIWNGLIFAGQNFTGSMHNHMLNPTQWPLALVPRQYLLQGITFFIWLQIGFIGFVATRIAGCCIDDWRISILTGMMVQLSGFVWFTTTTYIAVSPTLAAACAIYIVVSAEKRSAFANFVWLSACCSTVLLVGHIAYIFSFGLPIIVAVLAKSGGRSILRPWRGIAGVALLAACFGFVVSAMRVWPVIQSLLYESQAASNPYWLSSLEGNVAYWLLTGFIPDFIGYGFSDGQMTFANLIKSGRNSQFHSMFYIGAPAILFLAIAIGGAVGRHARLAALVFVFAALAAVFGAQPIADVAYLLFLPFIHDIVFRVAAGFLAGAFVIYVASRLAADDHTLGHGHLMGFCVLVALVLAIAAAGLAKVVHSGILPTRPALADTLIAVLRLLAAGSLVGIGLLAWNFASERSSYVKLGNFGIAFGIFFVISAAGVHAISGSLPQTAMVGQGIFNAAAAIAWAGACTVFMRTVDGPNRMPGTLAATLLALPLVVALCMPQDTGGAARGLNAILLAAFLGMGRFVAFAAVSVELMARYALFARDGKRLLLFAGILAVGELLIVAKITTQLGGTPFVSANSLFPGLGISLEESEAPDASLHDKAEANLLQDVEFERLGGAASWMIGGRDPKWSRQVQSYGRGIAVLENRSTDYATFFQDLSVAPGRMVSFGVWVRATRPEVAGIVLSGQVIFHSGSGLWEFLTDRARPAGRTLRPHLVVAGRGEGQFYAPSVAFGMVIEPLMDAPGPHASILSLDASLIGSQPIDLKNFRVNRPWLLTRHPYGQAQSSIPVVYGISTYGGVDSELKVGLYRFLTNFVPPSPDWITRGAVVPKLADRRVLDLLGVKYDFDAGGSLVVRPDALARFSLFSAAEVLPDEASILRRLKAADFDPTTSVLISERIPALPQQSSRRFEAISFEARKSSLIEVELDLKEPKVLLFNDTYSPAWYAEFGGKRISVIPANGAFMAVPLPPGSGTLRLIFRPEPFSTLFAVSTAAGSLLLGLCAIAFFSNIGRRLRTGGR